METAPVIGRPAEAATLSFSSTSAERRLRSGPKNRLRTVLRKNRPGRAETVDQANNKASSMNAVAVFIGVLAWGWLWGVWGLLLGIPILMAVKAVCDRVDHLKPIGELLGT